MSPELAFRAGLVELASEWPGLPIIHTVGIASAERGEDSLGAPAALVPFDARSFEGVRAAYPEELVAKLTFGPAARTAARDVPAYLAVIAEALRPVARLALACKAMDGEAAVGSLSIQREIKDHFPTCDDIEADVVLGGFSSMNTQGKPPL